MRSSRDTLRVSLAGISSCRIIMNSHFRRCALQVAPSRSRVSCRKPSHSVCATNHDGHRRFVKMSLRTVGQDLTITRRIRLLGKMGPLLLTEFTVILPATLSGWGCLRIRNEQEIGARIRSRSVEHLSRSGRESVAIRLGVCRESVGSAAERPARVRRDEARQPFQYG